MVNVSIIPRFRFIFRFGCGKHVIVVLFVFFNAFRVFIKGFKARLRNFFCAVFINRVRVSGVMVKGQVAIEFFLMLALVLGLIIISQGIMIPEKEDSLILGDALATKNFLNELTRFSRLATQLNGSVLSARLYSPTSEKTNCFYNESNRLYCAINVENERLLPSGVNKTFGENISTTFNLDACTRPIKGWGDYNFTVVNGEVKISC